MLFKHGTRTVHVIHYTDDTLELDAPLIYNNLKDIKQNGFGIFIDVITKKTLGCCVFQGNTSTQPMLKNETAIYLISNKKIESARQQAHTFIQSFNLNPIVLDVEELLDGIIPDEKSIYNLARLLKQQGHTVIMVSSQKEMLTSLLSSDITLITENL